MKNQGKIFASFLVAIAAGITIGLFYALAQDEEHVYNNSGLITDNGPFPPVPVDVEDWSDVNDSLGG